MDGFIMAKLDWTKAKKVNNTIDWSEHKKNQYSVKDVALKLSRRAETWPCSGKHHGTPIQQLPLDYLGWVGMNFDTASVGYKIALTELQRRAIVDRKKAGKL